MFYFDVLPDELISIIFHKVDRDNLEENAVYGTGIGSIDLIIGNYRFWNEHVRLLHPDAPFEYVSKHFYDYIGQDIIAITDNYRLFAFNYGLAKARLIFRATDMHPLQRFYEYRVSDITNTQILIDVLSSHFESKISLYEFITNRSYDVSIEISKGPPKFRIERKTFQIYQREAFGLFLHLLSNNHHELLR